MIESSSMPKAVVIGMPGAGKTRLGRETAALIKAALPGYGPVH